MTNAERTRIQDELIDSLPEESHGLLKLSPRSGKTRIAIKIIKNEKPESILWVTPNTKLRDEDIPQEFATWSAKRYLKKSTIICYGSLSAISGHYDKIILDEYQDITPANSEPFFNGQITYNSIIGLSGTHPKHQEKLDIYERLGLRTLADMSIDEAVDKGIVADYNITVVEVDLDDTEKVIEAGNAKKKWLQTEKQQYQYLDQAARVAMFQRRKDAQFKILSRMRAVYNSLSKEKAAKWLIDNLDGRKLVFSGSIKQAEKLSPHTYHSKTSNEDLQAFLKQEIDLLACVNAGGVGFTFRGVDVFIITQANSDKKGETTQKLTRSLLKQGEDYKADIYFLCLLGTQDAKWIEKALENFDKSKVTYKRFVNMQNGSE
jgi:superfamily II DNA or RNA helicase